MPTLNVYFEAVPNADLQQAAAEVQKKAGALPEVASASAEAIVTRGGPQEIVMAMQVAAGLMTSAAGAVVALTALVQGIEKLAAEMPALNKVLVQVGLKKVPVGQLTDHDKQMLVASLELA